MHPSLTSLNPVFNWLRDRQAPMLHRWMMHRASLPVTLTSAPALVLAPHHDDETFGCGGMIALKRDLGVPVSVVVLTDGAYSHSLDPSMERGRLMAMRKQEALDATGILGVPHEHVHFLDLPDNGLRHLPPERQNAAVKRLADLIKQYRPGELYIPHRTDRHPDHEAANRLAHAAVIEAAVAPEVLEYPIWLIFLGPLRLGLKRHELAGACRLEIGGAQDRKNRAIEVYRSQLHLLPRGFISQFTQGCEVFFRSHRS